MSQNQMKKILKYCFDFSLIYFGIFLLVFSLSYHGLFEHWGTNDNFKKYLFAVFGYGFFVYWIYLLLLILEIFKVITLGKVRLLIFVSFMVLATYVYWKSNFGI